VWRRRPAPEAVLWSVAGVLACWIVLEAVMTPYYIWPAVAVLVLVASGRPWWRFALAAAAAVFVTVWTGQGVSPWAYWSPMAVGLLVGLWAAAPPWTTFGSPDGERQVARSWTPTDDRTLEPPKAAAPVPG
jgi:hypothetical protein